MYNSFLIKDIILYQQPLVYILWIKREKQIGLQGSYVCAYEKRPI